MVLQVRYLGCVGGCVGGWVGTGCRQLAVSPCWSKHFAHDTSNVHTAQGCPSPGCCCSWRLQLAVHLPQRRALPLLLLLPLVLLPLLPLPLLLAKDWLPQHPHQWNHHGTTW